MDVRTCAFCQRKSSDLMNPHCNTIVQKETFKNSSKGGELARRLSDSCQSSSKRKATLHGSPHAEKHQAHSLCSMQEHLGRSLTPSTGSKITLTLLKRWGKKLDNCSSFSLLFPMTHTKLMIAPLPAMEETPRVHVWVEIRQGESSWRGQAQLSLSHCIKPSLQECRVPCRITKMNWHAEGSNYHQCQQKRSSSTKQQKSIPLPWQKHFIITY